MITKGDNLEYKRYILRQAKIEFMDNSTLKDEVAIRERIYDGESRILCFNAYGDPYPRPVRDIQRVRLMGAGYSKRGKVHQQFSKRENKFNTHNVRNQMQQRVGQNKIRKLNRKPGQYDLPVFDTDTMSDDIPDEVKHQLERQKKSEQDGSKPGGTGSGGFGVTD